MGRPFGAKNRQHARRRAALAEAALPRLLADRGASSLNELAAAVGVATPTLRHYFGDRAGLVAAALRQQRRRARPLVARLAAPSSPDLPTSLSELLLGLVRAWRRAGVGPVFTAGMAMGLGHDAVGPAYLDGVLEPTLEAVEARLRAHAGAGALRLGPDEADGLRAAALSLLAPVLLGLIHQDALGGASRRGLDLDAFVAAHVAAFVRAHGRRRRARPRRAA